MKPFDIYFCIPMSDLILIHGEMIVKMEAEIIVL